MSNEKNRKLAEWLGWQMKPFKGSRTVFAEDDEWCVNPIREDYECEIIHAPNCQCHPNILSGGCIGAKLPDFYTDETANALLLEKILDLGYQVIIDKQADEMPKGNTCVVVRKTRMSGIFKQAINRRAALVEAALALIAQEEKP